jgi:cytochrome c5
MKKTITISLLSLSILFLAQCAPKPASTTTANAKAPADEVAAIKQKYTQEQIDHGKAISISTCNKCHNYHQPQEFSVAKWERVLTKMIPKAKLNTDDGAMVSAYILTNAKLN